MKVAKYLVKDNEVFFETHEYFKDDNEFIKDFGIKPFWRLKNTEIETDDFTEINESDVEEVIYNQYHLQNPPIKKTYQYEWRYQKSMLWFITPQTFVDDTDFREYIKKIVVLDLIDFRRFSKPVPKEINI